MINQDLYYYCWDTIYRAGYIVDTFVSDITDDVLYFPINGDKIKDSLWCSFYDLYLKCRPQSQSKYNHKFLDKYDYNAFLDFKFGSGKWTVLEEYKNVRTPIKMKHECGNITEIMPMGLIYETRDPVSGCSKCQNSSNGELIIDEILKEFAVSYVRQYIFKECKDKRPLPFDFTLFSVTHNPVACIEYDGIQHFEMRDRFGEKNYYNTLRHDIIKNTFCEHNNISLLRIPYTLKTKKTIYPVIEGWLNNPIPGVTQIPV